MEPVLIFLGAWWWVAPAVAGAGAVGYSAMTSGRRRARRLELDAARHEQRTAYLALQTARIDSRDARANVLTAKARRDPGASFALAEARRMLHATKQAERGAALRLRAQRDRVRAALFRYRATGRDAPLPLEQVLARHDAVTARWLEYETDAAKALSFPQMLDSKHPSTYAFLRAQRDAQQLRPTSSLARLTPEAYSTYRDAVAQMEAAFNVAEADATNATRQSVAGLSWREVARQIARATGLPEPDLSGFARQPPAPEATAQQAPAQQAPPAPPRRDDVWPVPSRTAKP
ncbi:hypothetical protein LG299_11415 [Microbacterium lacus]|uniref:hypothetical protein n=1 Tax=Microbacterium lacus TaxID=415217 RepID=UPI003850595A